MRAPIFALLSLAIPVIVGTAGFVHTRNAKGATNMGEALAPLFVAALVLMIGAVFGEASAIISLIRGERLGWISWLGVIANGILVVPLIFLLIASTWK